MKNKVKLMFAFIMNAAILTSCSSVDLKKDEHQIRELWANANKFVCNGDWENYAKCWDHSSKIQLIHSDQGEWLRGWEQIGKKYEAMLSSGMRCSVSDHDLILNISPSGEMAWATLDVTIQFNDSTETKVRMWDTAVFEKIDGEWKMVLGMAAMPRNL